MRSRADGNVSTDIVTLPVTVLFANEEATTQIIAESAPASTSDASGSDGGDEARPAKININTAEKSELMELNGIGEVKAEAIITYRDENGAFKSVYDLLSVKGIGEKTLEKIIDKITI